MIRSENTGRKHPESCGQSIGFDGMYICQSEHIPCGKVKKCPDGAKEEKDG